MCVCVYFYLFVFIFPLEDNYMSFALLSEFVELPEIVRFEVSLHSLLLILLQFYFVLLCLFIRWRLNTIKACNL